MQVQTNGGGWTPKLVKQIKETRKNNEFSILIIFFTALFLFFCFFKDVDDPSSPWTLIEERRRDGREKLACSVWRFRAFQRQRHGEFVTCCFMALVVTSCLNVGCTTTRQNKKKVCTCLFFTTQPIVCKLVLRLYNGKPTGRVCVCVCRRKARQKGNESHNDCGQQNCPAFLFFRGVPSRSTCLSPV